MIKRSSGVLMNISSLPSEFSIGGFSKDAVYFAETIANMGFSWWQTLPITTIGVGNSPYSGVSAFALNYLYVDPYALLEQGLVNDWDIQQCKQEGEHYLADYGHAYYHKKQLLRSAYANVTDAIKEEMAQFYAQEKSWLFDYAVFMCLTDTFEGKPWYEWDEQYKQHDEKALAEFYQQRKADVDYYVFEQYEMQRQWRNLVKEVSKYGVRFIGDIPIYVDYGSVDVWSNRKEFLLDENLKPTLIAGVPPDYFAEDGQLWGNPVYDVAHMRATGYKWWLGRLKRCFDLYDCLRIDHFRGLYKFWACAPDAPNAKGGQWYDGLGEKFLKKLRETFPEAPIIAEDLGQIDDEVRAFLTKSGYPGMRVMQFAFDDNDSIHLPHHYIENCVAYTATHDNNTTLGWLFTASDIARNYALDYCGFSGSAWGAGGAECKSTAAFIRTLFMSAATLAVVPVQDLCGFGGDTRMNTPGLPTGNWEYRLTYEALFSIDRDYLIKMNELYGRRR